MSACLLGVLAALASQVVLKNDKVEVTEYNLKPGEDAKSARFEPGVMVYFGSGEVRFTPRDRVWGVQAGPTEMHFARIDFLTPGSKETWGAAGLAPNYKLLLENEYARVYEIKIPAGGREPQHTHKARVVVCLSGADLRHVMPDGRVEPSTLKTGEIAWRPGGTHTGENLGKTDLWVIAVEPK